MQDSLPYDDLPGRDALAQYFAANGMPADGGYGEKWVRADIGPIPFAYPNTASRRRLAPAHDLHHVLTGYGTDLLGEAEIAAWELASGMPNRTGRRLALRVLGFGVPAAPRRVFRAFVRGRRSRNLVERGLAGVALDRRVADLRRELGVAAPDAEERPGDRAAFARCAAWAMTIVWGPILPIGLGLWWWLGG